MGKTSKRSLEFKAESRREIYKFWLGFLEKVILLVLATIVIPASIARTEIPFTIRIAWLSLGVVLFIVSLVLSVKLSKLSITSEGGEA
jgi:hypothetical protein